MSVNKLFASEAGNVLESSLFRSQFPDFQKLSPL